MKVNYRYSRFHAHVDQVSATRDYELYMQVQRGRSVKWVAAYHRITPARVHQVLRRFGPKENQ